MKTLTVALPIGDRRQDDVRRFIEERFPDITDITFRETNTVTTPHAESLDPAFHEHELTGIDTDLFRHFNPLV
jgi:hypothetical protein